MLQKCDSCQIEFNCTLNKECWCNTLPTILTFDQCASCYCPTCLKKEIVSKIETLTSDKSKYDYIASLGVPDMPLEGIDYFTTKQGLLVFTKWYLLRRGSCCKNNCINCPYC